MLSILKASAGSGKTFALTYEFIRMLLGRKDDSGHYRLNRKENDRHRSILAITFTNKATDEMKQRIVHELAVLAGMEPSQHESPYMSKLTACYGCSPEAVRDEALRALRQLLFDFNFFHVSTIDSFFQQILRTFAYEAELEGDYEVDLDSDLAISRATDEIFTSLNEPARDPELEKEKRGIISWITEYLIDQIEQGSSVALFNRTSGDFEKFVRTISHLSDETFMEHLDTMMEYFRTDSTRRFRDALRARAVQALSDAKDAASAALDTIAANPLPKGASYDRNLVNALQKLTATGELPGGKTVAAIAAGDKAPCTKAGLAFLSENPGVAAAIADACSVIIGAQTPVREAAAIGSELFVLGLFRAVYMKLEQTRTTDKVLLLSDTNSLLRKIIGDDDAPFIFERVGISLRHFLIDEFQDTSRMQWQNLRPLIDESQSAGHDNLIIGDEKQCIYRFRGSAPELLQHHVEHDVVPPAEVRGNRPEENTNWRSSAEVIRANNEIFRAIADIYGYTDIYGNVCQQVAGRNLERHGYVDILRFDSRDSDTPFAEFGLSRMLTEIKRQLDSGYRGSDIAVLVRTRDDGKRVVDALLSAFSTDSRFDGSNLRVVSDDAMMLDSAPAVRRIVAVLRALSTARNREIEDAAGDAVSHHYRSQRELTNLINHYEQALGDGLTPEEALERSVGRCGEPVVPPVDLSQTACASLPSLVERIVAHYFPGGTVPSEQLMFVLAFEDAVADYCVSGNPDLQSFLRWWDDAGHRTMVAGAPDVNAVRVMTIHKSKGLEFPCVHLPLLHKKIFDFRDAEWFVTQPIDGIDPAVVPPMVAIRPAEWMADSGYAEQYSRICREILLDEINALYVAFTRAVDELIVTFDYSPAAKDNAAAELTRPTTGQLLRQALDRLGFNGGTMTAGEPTQAPEAERKTRRRIDPDVLTDMPAYRVDERNSLWQNTRVETLSEEQLGRRRGLVMHDILANVGVRADLRQAVAKAVRSGALKAAMSASTLEELERAMDAAGEHTDRWFAPGARTLCERPIVMPDGVALRPDRVVMTPDGCLEVVDYKFGSEHRRSYAAQVRSYVNALKAIGYERVSGYLWYVTEGRVESV